ncbi:FkbM family methyltransferase [Paraburkholderia bonniea]|uniref:FkbM family methyltransferase n=1 Tax=Paraburkholderia bonniea TaxID=2152891 RepID=UPI001291E485|nr:FkbM family methyltransferase [Paraburkholderia bonniea]WJF92142.1 FkbM family methyltransferase [Paraburkholderia bonniea]WJF95462.1 FkbM family methyltransferase [Paraburkholderia bonniea]
MPLPNRPIAFILAASNHGTMIVNRNDYNLTSTGGAYGVGHQILHHSSFDANEVGFVLALLTRRREYFGDGVFAIDGGANIGVHTIEWARHMYGWGQVLSFEAQEIVYYALAGNIAINNCLNARAKLAALGEQRGELIIPQPDYFAHASFGSLELRQQEGTEYIGQRISYDPSSGVTVPLVSIDSLELARADLIKLDVEGMEVEVLRGARKTLKNLKPILTIEILKSDQAVIKGLLDELGYRYFPAGINLIAVHTEDPVLQHLSHIDGMTYIS